MFVSMTLTCLSTIRFKIICLQENWRDILEMGIHPSQFMKDYFSEEILELLGGALGKEQIDTLLAWLRDEKKDLVVRKVAAMALGFCP